MVPIKKVKNVSINIRVSKELKDTLQRKADKQGVKLTELVREGIKYVADDKVITDKAVFEILVNNLNDANQLKKIIDAGKYSSLQKEDMNYHLENIMEREKMLWRL